MRAVLFLFFGVVVVSVQGVSAQVRGRVLDPSGAVVADATVSIASRSSLGRAAAQTDSQGEYAFSGLAVGEWLLAAQAPGFGASKAQVLTVGQGSEQKIDLTLELQRVSAQIQVTASGGAQTVDETAKTLTVVDAQQLSDRAEYSVVDAIRNVPGIRVQQLGGPGGFSRVTSRGMRPMDTSLLVDGFRLRDAASPQGEASALLGDLLLAGTERIEVLRGSGSSLYGTHATSGVVNIITASGSEGFHGEAGAEGGGLGLFQGLAKVSGSALEQRLRFSLAGTHLNVTEGIDGNDRARNSVAHGSMQYSAGPRTELTARILMNDSFAQLNSSPFLDANQRVATAADDPDSRRAAGYFSGLFAVNHTWTPRVSSRVSYQGVNTRRDNRNGSGGVSFQPESNASDVFDGRLDTIQARTDIQLGRHWITGGYEWEREDFDNISQPAEARLRINQRSHAMFAQDQLQFLDRRLQISLSGRMQGFQLDSPRFSDNTSIYDDAPIISPSRAMTGDLSAAYFVRSTGTKVRAHIGNGYRVPSLYERFGASYFFGSFSAFGDPALRPDRLLAMDGGIDQYLGSRAKVSATYFYTRIQEAIIFDFSGFINPATDPYSRFGGYRNTAGGLARGLELSFETNPIRTMTIRSSYTFTNADERVSTFANGSLRTVRVSDHMFTGTATQRLGRSLDVTFDIFAASNYLMNFSSQPYAFRGPVKADLSFNYTHTLTDNTRLRFFTRIDNVLNRSYTEEGFVAPKAWAVAGMRLLF